MHKDHNPYGLSEDALTVGITLFRAEEQDSDTSLPALAQAASLDDNVAGDAISELMDHRLVQAHGQMGGPPVIESTPLLAEAVAGRLDYSPNDDDQRVLTALAGAERNVHLSAREIAETVGITPRRTNESVARLEHRGLVEVMREMGRSEYSFTSASATPRGRRRP